MICYCQWCLTEYASICYKFLALPTFFIYQVISDNFKMFKYLCFQMLLLVIDRKKDALALLLGSKFSNRCFFFPFLRKCLILLMHWLLLKFVKKYRKTLTSCKPEHSFWKKYFIPKGMLIYLLSLSLKYTNQKTLHSFLN